MLYFVLAMIQSIRVAENASLMVITHCLMTFSCWIWIFSCQFPNFVQLSGVVQLCNGFIELEQNFTKYLGNTEVQHGRNSAANLYIRGMIYLLTSAGIIGASVFCLDILRNPCFPVYVGYWISSQCEPDRPGYYLQPTWGLIEVVSKITIAIPVLFVLTPLLVGCCFQVSLEFIMEGHCFRIGIAEFGRYDSIN